MRNSGGEVGAVTRGLPRGAGEYSGGKGGGVQGPCPAVVPANAFHGLQSSAAPGKGGCRDRPEFFSQLHYLPELCDFGHGTHPLGS